MSFSTKQKLIISFISIFVIMIVGIILIVSFSGGDEDSNNICSPLCVLPERCVNKKCKKTNFLPVWDSLTGQKLLNKFELFSGNDPTAGSVNYNYCNNPDKCNLISVANNRLKLMVAGAGNNVPVPKSGLIPSVRLYTRKRLFNGGIFSFEIFNIPAGCGVWPALWFSQDSQQYLPKGHTGDWPKMGEIDLIEQVNDMNRNSTTLHIDYNKQCSPVFEPTGGTTKCTDTDIKKGDGNEGCGIKAPANSFGSGFNNKYGKDGVAYVMYWEKDKFIKTWFIVGPNYNRVSGPFGSDPNPDSWGKPYAYFDISNTDCPIQDQQLIINITLCGEWAGKTFRVDCPSIGQQCIDYIYNKDNIKDAYWDIGRVSVYEKNI